MRPPVAADSGKHIRGQTCVCPLPCFVTFKRFQRRPSVTTIAHVHVADTWNHKASSGLRYIVNPPGAKVTVHQHMDMYQSEIDWDVFFSSLANVGFDGIVTACVFGWEERADQPGTFMRRKFRVT
ncbi:TIM barrel protein [Pseudomonas sp. CDFA 610]|uniref:TIM barrel protein n=1 Tax=Pseudomonas sp. CDFA 610 TaxID=2829825 RepID=UPI003FA79ED0